MSYAIDVERVSAGLQNLRGEFYQATFFVHLMSSNGDQIETIGERLNDPDLDFLPIEIGGRAKLVRVASIAFVKFVATTPDLETLYHGIPQRERVRVRLRTEEQLSGELVFQAPHDRCRVSDLLNSRAHRFLILVDHNTTYYVQRTAIDEVDLEALPMPRIVATGAGASA